MAKKTNKTSHVLNLLTNHAPAEDTDASGTERKSEVPSHSAAPTKVTVVDEGSRNDRVSQEILTHLSEELELEVPDVEEVPVESSAPHIQIPRQTQAAPSAPVPDTLPEELTDLPEESVQEDSEPVHKSGERLVDRLQDDSFHFINVMEELIMQHDLDQVLGQYGVCTCTRCKADVCALTLSGLPAKYVVAGTHSLSPILNYYKNRYRISILSELSKACTTVREHPHHGR